MAQEFWDENNQSQEMEEVLNLLNECNIDFEVKGNKIMIKGDIRYADLHSLPGIAIFQGDNEIGFEEFRDWNRIVVTTPNHARDVILSKNVYADYYYPYLVIHF